MEKSKEEGAVSISRAPEKIIEAALAEFSEHGIDGARVDGIVKRAGVSKQLFYYYFESKEEIYKLVLEKEAERAIRLILDFDYSNLSAENALKLFLRRVFDQYIDMPWLIKFTMDQDHHCGAHISPRNKLRSLMPAVIARVDAIQKQGKASGEFKADISPEFLYTASILMLRGCFMTGTTFDLIPGMRPSARAFPQTWREQCIDFILSALRAVPAPRSEQLSNLIDIKLAAGKRAG